MYGMYPFLKILWAISTSVVFLSLTWFLFGATANFQRTPDLLGVAVFIFFWWPALIMTVISIFALITGWMPKSLQRQISLAATMTFLAIFLTPIFFQSVNTDGWLKENVERDISQITSDEKYEYRLELVNLFQRNSYARLHVIDVATDNEMLIPLDICTREIAIVTFSNVTNLEDSNTKEALTEMNSTDRENIYMLSTTERIYSGFYIFEIDLSLGTSRRVE